MTQRSVTYLKGRFESGDIPTQTDYGDVFDSFVNLESSAAQTMSGSIVIPGIDATRVSATTVSADTVHTSALFTRRLDANIVSAATITAASASFSRVDVNTVSAATVSANSIFVGGNLRLSSQYVSAAGTTQSSARAVTATLIRASAEQNERSIVLNSLTPGRVQYIMNSGTTALLVFPPSGQNFIGSAANGAISIPTLTGVTIPHFVSAYGFIR